MAVKRIDYATKDYLGFKEGMIEQIPSILPEWTDHSETDAGIVILELLAHRLEILSYYNDRVANESFLSTATQRRSVINHCKLIGYDLEWYTASKFYQVFEIVPQLEDTLIPKGTQLGTIGSEVEEPVIFETVQDLVIPAGSTGLEKDVNEEYIHKVEIEHGQTITDEYVGDVLTDEPFQEFKLSYLPVLKDSIEVYVDEPTNGISLWERQDDFISSNQDSNHYVAEMNEYDEVFIQFGNGVSGRIPEQYSKVLVNYKVGGGEVGNVGTNTIVEVYDPIIGFVSTTNPLDPHIKGKNKEDIETAKINGPASLKLLNRYVTIPDFEEGLLLDFDWVIKTKAVNNAGNVDLYVVADTGQPLTTEQRNELTATINEKKVIFTIVNLLDPTYIAFDVTVDLITYDNYDPDFIKYAGENIIADLFSPENMDFGKDITIAEIHYELMKIEGVRNAVVSLPAGDVAVGDVEIGNLGTTTVTVNGA